MKRIVRAAALMIMALSLLPTNAFAAVEPDHSFQLDDEDNRSVEYTSGLFVGVAPSFFAGGTAGNEYECGDTGDNCEFALFEVTGLTEQEIADDAAARAADPGLKALTDRVNYSVGITNYSVPVSDLDIIIWQSNADGDKITELGRVGALDTDPSEEFTGSFTATAANPTQYFLMEIVFFAGAGTYDGYMNVS